MLILQLGSYSPKFSSKRFRVLAFMVRSLSHLKLISVYGVRYSWSSFFLTNIHPVLPAPFVKDPPLLTELVWHLGYRLCVHLFLDSLFYSSDLLVYPYVNATLSWLLSFIVTLQIWLPLSFTSVLLRTVIWQTGAIYILELACQFL